MTDQTDTLFLTLESGREYYYRLVGTPKALRTFSDSLSASLGALPATLERAQELHLGGVVTADAAGSRRETYLSIRAEPSLEWLALQRRRKTRRDWLVTTFLVATTAFAFFGFATFVRWLLNITVECQ